MVEFSKQYEALMRNQIITALYGSLPSYCIWTEDDILKEDTSSRLDWWRKMISEAEGNNIDVDKRDESEWPFVTIREYAIKWIVTIKKQKKGELKPTIEFPTEYCSKRLGDHLSCDI